MNGSRFIGQQPARGIFAPPRWGRRSKPCLGSAFKIVASLQAACLCGAMLGSPAWGGEEIRFQRVYVPQQRMESLVNGQQRYIPLPVVDFERLILGVQPDLHPPLEHAAVLERAHYRASLTEASFLRGQVQWTISHHGDNASLLPLRPLNIALSSRPVSPNDTAGSSAAFPVVLNRDENCLYVERSGDVVCDWELAAQSDEEGTLRFLMEVPTCRESVLELDLPVEWELQASGRGVVAVEHVEIEMENRWLIRASGPFNLNLQKTGHVTGFVQTFARFQFAYALRSENTRLNTLAQLSSWEGIPSSFSLWCDPQLRFESITVGGQNVPWRRIPRADDGPDRILLNLSDWTDRTTITLDLAAVSATTFHEASRLPRLWCDHRHWIGSEARLTVSPSLVLGEWSPHDTLPPETPSAEGMGWILAQPDAEVQLVVEPAPPWLRWERVTSVTVEGRQLVAACVLQVEPLNVPLQSFSARIHPGWEITKVSAEGTANPWGSWRVEEANPSGAASRMILDFSPAWPPGESRRLKIHARRMLANGVPLCLGELPPFTVSGEATRDIVEWQDLEVLPGLSMDSPPLPDAGAITELEESAAALLARPIRGEFWRLHPHNLQTKIPWARQAEGFEATMATEVTISPATLHERTVVECLPRQTTLQAVELVFSHPVEPLESYRFTATDGTPLHAERLSASATEDRTDADRWLVTLPEETSSRVEFVVERRIPSREEQQVGLVSLPRARSQSGTVTLRSASGIPIAIHPSGMTPAFLEPVPRDSEEQLLGRYTYLPEEVSVQGGPELRIVRPESHTPATGAWAISCDVHARWRPNNGMRYDVRYRIVPRGQKSVSIQMPKESQLELLAVDGQTIEPAMLEDARALQIELPALAEIVQLAVCYRVPAETDWPWWPVRTIEPRLPRLDIAVWSTRATLDCPCQFKPVRGHPTAHAAWNAGMSGLAVRGPLVEWPQWFQRGIAREIQAHSPRWNSNPDDAFSKDLDVVLSALGEATFQRNSTLGESWAELLKSWQRRLWNAEHDTRYNVLLQGKLAATLTNRALLPGGGNTDDPLSAAIAFLRRHGLVLTIGPEAILVTTPADMERHADEVASTRLSRVYRLRDGEWSRAWWAKSLVQDRAFVSLPQLLGDTAGPGGQAEFATFPSTDLEPFEQTTEFPLDAGPTRMIRGDMVLWAEWILPWIVAGLATLWWPQKPAPLIFSFAACMLLGVVLPSPLHGIPDAAVLGLAIGWLATLARTWNSKRTAPRASSLAQSFTVALLACLLIVRGVYGQAENGAASLPYQVLFPLDARGRVDADACYVPEPLFRALQASQEPLFQLPGGYLTRADYEGRIEPAAVSDGWTCSEIQARYEVRVFAEGGLVDLPVDPLFLDQEAEVLVDSYPVRYIWLPNQPAIRLGRLSRGIHRVEFVLRPRQERVGNVDRWWFGIAPFPQSTLRLQVPPDQNDDLVIPSAIGAVRRRAGWIEAELGPASHVEMRRFGEADTPPSAANVEALTWMSLDLSTSIPQFRLRIRGTIRDGTVRSLILVSDGSMRFYPSEEGAAARLAPRAVSENQGVWTIELPEPQQEAFEVELRGDLPQALWPGPVSIPAWSLEGLDEAERWLAFHHSGMGAVDSPVPLRGLAPVSRAEFQATWGVPTAANTQFYQWISREDGLEIRLPRFSSEPGVRQTVSLGIGQPTWRAKVETRFAASAGYRPLLTWNLPPGFRASEIVMVQAEQESAVPWRYLSPTQLQVFLPPATGQPRLLRMQGAWEPLDLDGPPPTFAPANVLLREHELQLFRGPDVLASIPGMAESLSRQDQDVEGIPDLGRFVARFPVEETDNIQLRISPNQIDTAVAQTVWLSREGQGWRVGMNFDVEVLSGVVDRLIFQVPTSWNVELAAAEFSAPSSITRESPGTHLIVTPQRAIDGAFTFSVSGRLPALDVELSGVPLLPCLNLKNVRQVVILPTSQAEQRFRWKVQGGRRTSIPTNFLGPNVAQTTWRAWEIRSPEPLIQAATLGSESIPLPVALADLQIAWQEPDQYLGWADYYLEPSQAAFARIEVPTGVAIASILVEGNLSDAFRDDDGSWRIPLGLGGLPQKVSLAFRGIARQDDSGKLAITVPELAGPSGLPAHIAKSLWSVELPLDLRMVREAQSDQYVARWRQDVERIQALSRLIDLAPMENAGGERAAWFHVWRDRLESVRQSLASAIQFSTSSIAISTTHRVIQSADETEQRLIEKLGIAGTEPPRSSPWLAMDAIPQRILSDTGDLLPPLRLIRPQGDLKIRVERESPSGTRRGWPFFLARLSVITMALLAWAGASFSARFSSALQHFPQMGLALAGALLWQFDKDALLHLLGSILLFTALTLALLPWVQRRSAAPR